MPALIPLNLVFEYHELSKHKPNAYAPGPGYMDWANQPNPFRTYAGTEVLKLKLIEATLSPDFEDAINIGKIPPRPLSLDLISQIFQDSLGLSAWKQFGNSSWALRMNPSSGNLHPTEAYILSGAVPGLIDTPFIAHYASRIHSLELRTKILPLTWEATHSTQKEAFYICLSSIPWRESWKYGERAFRYCNHDLGHAIAALSFAASAVGWKVQLCDDFGSDDLQNLFGLNQTHNSEPEYAECLLMLSPNGTKLHPITHSELNLLTRSVTQFEGTPNRLSSDRVAWTWVEKMPVLCKKGPSDKSIPASNNSFPLSTHREPIPLRKIIHQRRSAVDMESNSTMESDSFYSLLERTVPNSLRVPFLSLQTEALAHFLIFVNRVKGLDPGLYFLVRNPKDEGELKLKCNPEFLWKRPETCPSNLQFFQLLSGDFHREAQAVSCFQEIAANGCFSLGMLTKFKEPLEKLGAWMYPRLYWECGLVGQVLYLEADVAGLRATGIGCFFDDSVHQILGLKDNSFQSLYHFTVGQPIEDSRLVSLPPYSI